MLVLVRGAMGAAAAQEDGYYDDDDYDAAAEYEYDDYPPEAMEEAYYVVDLDPKAPGTTIQRAYMKCFLPFHPEAPAQDGDWRVADPGLQVRLACFMDGLIIELMLLERRRASILDPACLPACIG